VARREIAGVMGWPGDVERAERVLGGLLRDGLMAEGIDGSVGLASSGRPTVEIDDEMDAHHREQADATLAAYRRLRQVGPGDGDGHVEVGGGR
jgi:hypothetical protein